MTDRIRVGIVGAHVGPDGQSWGARAHIPALKALPEIDLVAVCNRHRATAEETAEHFGIPQAFDSVEAMLTQGDLDVVDVASTGHRTTPSSRRRSMPESTCSVNGPLALRWRSPGISVPEQRRRG